MLERVGAALSRISQRFIPDPFVLAVLLTFISFAAALAQTGLDGERVLVAWLEGSGGGKGFWNLLAFGMQMCLILVTGHALAQSPPLARALDALARRARTPRSAIVIVATGAMVLGLLNWGLGLVGGALLAREVGQRARRSGVRVHYPLLVAAGYSGMLVWHGGLSGSAPLKVTLNKDLVEILGADLAARVGEIPLDQTLLTAPNLLGTLCLVLALPWVLVKMLPSDERARVAAPLLSAEVSPAIEPPAPTPAARLDHSRALVLLLAAAGLVAWWFAVRKQGLLRLDPNSINFLFLFLGLALHGSARAYVDAVTEAARGCAGIILQFPFYAGIMGVLAGTGLLARVATGLAAVGPDLLPAVSFYAAGLVNLFVPSGGGQWAVQGPVLMQAAVDHGLPPARLVMALAYGDQWTNMLQPFWALPLLGITGAKARDIIGYTAVLLLVSQAAFLVMLYVGW